VRLSVHFKDVRLQWWFVGSSQVSCFTSCAGINFGSKVDGADLGTLLADGGEAPRHDIPPSTCPLNLVNP
jgi:hypothetical protein